MRLRDVRVEYKVCATPGCYPGPSQLVGQDILNCLGLCENLISSGRGTAPSPGKRVWEFMATQSRQVVHEVASVARKREIDSAEKTAVARALNGVLLCSDFYDEAYFGDVNPAANVPLERIRLFWRRPEFPNGQERFNRLLLEASYREEIREKPRTAYEGDKCPECHKRFQEDKMRKLARRRLIIVGTDPEPYKLCERSRCRNRIEHYRKLTGRSPTHQRLGEDWDNVYDFPPELGAARRMLQWPDQILRQVARRKGRTLETLRRHLEEKKAQLRRFSCPLCGKRTPLPSTVWVRTFAHEVNLDDVLLWRGVEDQDIELDEGLRQQTEGAK